MIELTEKYALDIKHERNGDIVYEIWNELKLSNLKGLLLV